MHNKTSKREKTGQLSNKTLNRREFLGKTGCFLATGLLTGVAPSYLGSTRKSLKYPFTLGVASGDPWPNSVLLWTRLAPEPLMGASSMPNHPVDVQWQVARTPSFTRIIKHGTAVAKPHYAHSLHVDVKGLEPNKYYYYRFKAGNETSPIGRTKTAPAKDAKIDELKIAFASCNKYCDGFYNAYEHLAKEDLDVVFFLGDYIYEKGKQGHIGRGHIPQHVCRTLKDYRIRYGQYKSDSNLQAAHAAFPWIAIEDDHDIENDWAGTHPEPRDFRYKEDFLARRTAAFQAYYENLPFRKASEPHGIYMQLYRKFRYGKLVEFNVLDTRQYRTDFACNNHNNVLASKCKAIYSSKRTMLGWKQEKWLFGNLKDSTADWNILPQQVVMAQINYSKGPELVLDMDKWDGYVSTRNRLFKVVEKNNIKSMVVLSGDYHRNMANNLLENFNEPDSPVLASELLGTSMASNGDLQDMTKKGRMILKYNSSDIKFFNAQRGYVRCKITPDEIRADYRIVPYVSKLGSPIHTRATFKIKNGSPGVNRV
jgi:alkaline phosphatase D